MSVVVLQPDTGHGQGVQVRGWNRAAVVANICIALVIGKSESLIDCPGTSYENWPSNWEAWSNAKALI